MTEAKEYIEERAAITEYDGVLTRAEAERRAMQEIKRRYRGISERG